MRVIRKIFYALPVKWRYLVRRLIYLPYDMVTSLSKQKDELRPPKGKIYTGGGDFKKTGEKFLQFFIEYGKLQPNHHVLDIGSGIGRMAIPLTKYLTESARYEGFDVVEEGVKWCQNNISTKYDNFHFQFISLHNDLYTKGGEDSTGFTFPFDDRSFDFTFLISVFTHMKKEEMEHYLREIHRVLKSGARCFVTFFVIDGDQHVTNNKFNFPYDYGDYKLMDKTVTGANIAFKQSYLWRLIEKSGLAVENYYKGSWKSDENDSLDFQDILVLTKK